MSIRPLDVALTVQRTTDINRSQTNEGLRPETVMQQSAEKIQKDVQEQDQNVTQTNKVEENSIDRDGKGSGGGEGGRGKGRKREHKEEKKSDYSGLLDISI